MIVFPGFVVEALDMEQRLSQSTHTNDIIDASWSLLTPTSGFQCPLLLISILESFVGDFIALFLQRPHNEALKRANCPQFQPMRSKNLHRSCFRCFSKDLRGLVKLMLHISFISKRLKPVVVFSGHNLHSKYYFTSFTSDGLYLTEVPIFYLLSIQRHGLRQGMHTD